MDNMCTSLIALLFMCVMDSQCEHPDPGNPESASGSAPDDHDLDPDELDPGQGHKHVAHGVIGGIIIICVALLSLCVFLAYWCHEKSKRERVMEVLTQVSTPTSDWGRKLVCQIYLMCSGFGQTSDGMGKLDTHKVVRTRKGRDFTDGARWNVAMTSGKHLFEVVWREAVRGTHASVGVGTEHACLKARGPVTLVGIDAESCGIDIVTRKVVNAGTELKGHYPPDIQIYPDRFLMFVDVDGGRVGYGTESVNWGDVTHCLPGEPLYVMVASDTYNSEVQIKYRGSADANATSREPPPPAATNDLSMTTGTNVTSGRPVLQTETSSAPQVVRARQGPDGVRRVTKRLLPSPPQSPDKHTEPPCFQAGSPALTSYTTSCTHISGHHGNNDTNTHEAAGRPQLLTQSSRCELLVRTSQPCTQTQSPPRRHPHIANSYTKYYRH